MLMLSCIALYSLISSGVFEYMAVYLVACGIIITLIFPTVPMETSFMETLSLCLLIHAVSTCYRPLLEISP